MKTQCLSLTCQTYLIIFLIVKFGSVTGLETPFEYLSFLPSSHGIPRITPDQENFAYIPLSSLIILLVILLTCASRRKKIDAFNALEQSYDENDIKAEYAIMCFPCLKKKPVITDCEPSEELADQFEYIVEKYTIRKVPLLLANTAEDIKERQEELELARASENQPQSSKDNFLNFQVSQEVYNVQKIPPCITLAANTVCPGKRALKEKPRASDILESMSPINRPPMRNHNYVVIPTKGSLRHKDIMMTKREITNQYLNNFSSVFVDNLKDQVPKDPEQFPRLSRPYTSAFKSFPIDDNQTMKHGGSKRSKKGKNAKVAYAYPLEETHIKEESSEKEEPFLYDSDSAQEHMSDMLDSEFQEDVENDTTDFTDKSKSLVLLNDSESVMTGTENIGNPFKTTIKSTSYTLSELESKRPSSKETDYRSGFLSKEEWVNTKSVTYEDIQALDVGYEFTSCEKLGVKPKMTRIHCPIEAEKFKESLKLALGDTNKLGKKCLSQEQSLVAKAIKPVAVKLPTVMPARLPEGLMTQFGGAFIMGSSERTPSRNIVAETSFLPTQDSTTIESTETPLIQDAESVTTEGSKVPSMNEVELNNTTSATVVDSVMEISELYDLSRSVSNRKEVVSNSTAEPVESLTGCQILSKSRSFHEPGVNEIRNENKPEGKGKDNLPFPDPNSAPKIVSRVDERDTETTYSLDSRDSKTSSAVTTPRSSEIDEDKRATLRWKIVIKHHREDDSSRRNLSNHDGKISTNSLNDRKVLPNVLPNVKEEC